MAAAHDAPPDGLQTVWETHEKWLWAVVYARLREHGAAQEVMQETALALTRSEGLAISDWGPWLYRVAIRQAMLYRRKVGRSRRLVERFAGNSGNGIPEKYGPDPLAWLLVDERQKLVRQALEQLPRRDAEILLLKHGEDWSYRQIASHLGVSETAVEARLHRARSRLREMLARTHIHEGLNS